MDKAILQRRLAIGIRVPIQRCERATFVLAAALAEFGPQDPVNLVITPDDETVPTLEHNRSLRRMLADLEQELGPLPQLSVTAAAQVETASLAIDVRASGDPAEDAAAAMVLNSFGRRVGSGRIDPTRVKARPRGGYHLARAEAVATTRRRDLYQPRPADAPVRMAIFLWGPNLFSVVETVLRAAQEHPLVQVDVVCPRSPAGEFQAFFDKHGVQTHDEVWLRQHLNALDIVLTPDPYDEPRPAAFHALALAESGVRLVYLPYAQSLSGEAGNLRQLHNLPIHNLAWRIFVANDQQLENYRLHCDAGADHVRALGAGKNERLLTSQKGREQAEAIRATLATSHVTLWNPHWTMSEVGWSTFARNLAPIMQYFTRHPERGLIVRPHPGLLTAVSTLSGQDAPKRVARFRAMCDEMANVYLDLDYDHVPALLAADAMISDLSSLVAEYSCLGRPLGLLTPPSGLELNGDRGWKEGTVEINSERQLIEFLDHPSTPSGVGPSHADLGAGARIVEAIVDDLLAELCVQR